MLVLGNGYLRSSVTALRIRCAGFWHATAAALRTTGGTNPHGPAASRTATAQAAPPTTANNRPVTHSSSRPRPGPSAPPVTSVVSVPVKYVVGAAPAPAAT